MTTLSCISASPSVSSSRLSPSALWSVDPKGAFSPDFNLVQFSVRENLLIVTGTPESKQLASMLPEILKQVGP
jgi:hypothetical protein